MDNHEERYVAEGHYIVWKPVGFTEPCPLIHCFDSEAARDMAFAMNKAREERLGRKHGEEETRLGD